ncbi:3-dehydroquinate synthase [Levilactobacillus acidifarinae]|uniref:3-dehydroquinate synthase n=1 Tax=Levilactobacillus acidifarinae DSM 19394 = JCM 15949 TaxID=1423715 RepID=A0A0R1LLV1_9LACO|nr:3-dehydroquinate synthase [Levilactobacillus acidifarinae]KRK96783.1 3-dehydroquinate synthase [Levilactobacillus acidifarinae DSM 19394]GEO69850.1 3-dehydroquinate synthase [Levilactobacillus acidifarinae]
MTTIPVTTAAKSYAVNIETGLLVRVGTELAKVWSPRQVAIVTDTNVGPLYAQQVRERLTAAGFRVTVLTVPAGESSKSWAQVMRLIDALSAAQLTRSDGVLALGGGVVGDLAGFVAAIYLRGIAFAQVPTSLLAQVDSSVGGKTAIDLPTGKNLVGSFYQPDVVLIDPQTLTTLPPRMLVEGYGEILKCAALVGSDFWALVQTVAQPADILAQAAPLIRHSIAFKARVVMADEKEGGQRQLLNFGHTIGHAVELWGRGRYMHGEAVAIGLVQVARLFAAQGLMPAELTNQLRERLMAVGLPVEFPVDLTTTDLLAAMHHDKKIHDQALTWVYLTAIGQPAMHAVPLANLATWIAPVTAK